LTGARFGLTKRRMQEAEERAHQIRLLAGVAAHLCSAIEGLARSDCDWYTTDLLEMLSAIDGQIAVLKGLDAGRV